MELEEEEEEAEAKVTSSSKLRYTRTARKDNTTTKYFKKWLGGGGGGGDLKGKQTDEATLARKGCKHFSLHALLGCSVKCLQQKYFLLQMSAPWATAMWVCSLPTESRKRLADNIWCHRSTQVKCLFFNKPEETDEKLLCVYFLLIRPTVIFALLLL